MSASTTRTYGSTLAINEDVSLSSVIVSDLTVTPAFETTTYGKPEKAAVRRLVSVDYSGTVTFLSGTTETAVDTAVETWAAADAPARYPDICPTGGSVIVELGQSSIVPGEAKTASFSAKYYPSIVTAAS